MVLDAVAPAAPATATPRHRAPGRAPRPSAERRLGPAPSGAGIEPHLDGVRAVAVLMVLVCHVSGWIGDLHLPIFGVDIGYLLPGGSFGVNVFLILSGYLLARPWFVAELAGGRSPDVRRYLGRRLARIVPAYYVSLAVLLCIYVPGKLIPSAEVTGTLGLRTVGLHLLFLQHLFPVTSVDFNGVDGAYWTLTVEMMFYLLLPVVVPLFYGRRWRVTVPASIAVSLVWEFVALHRSDWLTTIMMRSVAGRSTVLGMPTDRHTMQILLERQIPQFAFTFAIGIALSRYAVVRSLQPPPAPGTPVPTWQRRPVEVALALTGPAAALLLTAILSGHLAVPGRGVLSDYLYQLVASAAFGVSFAAVTFGSGFSRRPLELPPMRFLACISYGIFLNHLLVLNYLFSFTPIAGLDGTQRFWVGLGLTLLIVVPWSVLSWVLIERPFLVRTGGPRSAPGTTPEHGPIAPTAHRDATRVRTRSRCCTAAPPTLPMPSSDCWPRTTGTTADYYAPRRPECPPQWPSRYEPRCRTRRRSRCSTGPATSVAQMSC